MFPFTYSIPRNIPGCRNRRQCQVHIGRRGHKPEGIPVEILPLQPSVATSSPTAYSGESSGYHQGRTQIRHSYPQLSRQKRGPTPFLPGSFILVCGGAPFFWAVDFSGACFYNRNEAVIGLEPSIKRSKQGKE